MSRPSARERVRARLRDDHAFYAEHALKIVGPGGAIMPLVPKPGQVRLYEAIERQRAAGAPERVIVLKARKLGYSTATQGVLIQRSTQRENYNALVVAQDTSTAGVLFDIGQLMYARLPADIKPERTNFSNATNSRKFMRFGNPSRREVEQGDMGLNSSIAVDSAREITAGRGFTIHGMHLSEVAFWPYPEKMTALLNAVPKEPGTLIVIESTANGHNHFRERWLRAESGESGFAAVFAPWHEEPAYATAFDTPAEREAFESLIGEGPFGEDEPRLVEEFGCSPEQLLWRRRAIVDDCDSKVEVFKQEFPASSDEAFLQTGKHVFSIHLISRAMDRAKESEEAVELGLLRASGFRERKLLAGTVQVPTGVSWVPREATGFGPGHAFWRVWEPPVTAVSQKDLPPDERKPLGQYVIGVDVSAGEENTKGERAFHAIEVIDHRTLAQVAEYRSRIDVDLLTEQVFLAALLYNDAWIAPEVTGGWGIPVVKTLQRVYGARFLYKRTQVESARGAQGVKEMDRLGYYTDRRTKPILEDGFRELLREGTHGIRSALLARELTTYVRRPDGRTGPEDGAFSDLLMAYMIAQQVAREKPLRAPTRRVTGTGSTVPVDPVTGYGGW